MKQTQKRSIVLGTVATFLIAGALAGLFFSWLITRPSLTDLWFTRQEIWIFNTVQTWCLAGALFFLATVSAYFVSHQQGWLRISPSVLHRIVAMGLIVAIPLVGWLLSSQPLLVQFFLGRCAITILLSTALFILTQRMYKLLAVSILIACLASTVLANLLEALVGSLPIGWFQALQYLIGATLLSTLSGYWLAKPRIS